MKRLVSSCLTLTAIFGISQAALATTEDSSIEPDNIVGTKVASINATSVNSEITGGGIANPEPGKNYIAQCTRYVSGTSAYVGFVYLDPYGGSTIVGRAHLNNLSLGVYNNFSTSSYTGVLYPRITNTGSTTINAGFDIFKT